jgi:hypothetical protein
MTDKPFSRPGDGWQPSTPLDNMDYLDGYLSSVYDSDMPDGAWFQAQVDLIAEHWKDVKNLDAHECFMQYLVWKEKPR